MGDVRPSVAMVLSNDGSADPRVEKEARALVDAGWDVTVVAWDRSQTLPAKETRAGGWRLHRVGPVARHGAGLGNLDAYQRFWSGATDAVADLAPHVVHCHDADAIPVGTRAVRRLDGAHLVVDLHELYAQSKMIPQRGWKGIAARGAVKSYERRGVRRSSLVVVANPGQVSLVAGLAEDDPRLAIVENAPERDRFEPASRQREAGDPFKVCFIGQKRSVSQLEALMRAIEPHADMSALLAGGGTAADDIERLGTRYERVETRGRVAYDEIPALYEGCDVVYAVYDTTYGNYRTHFPVKAMEGMALGVPVLVSKGTWVADYVEQHGIGLAVREGDPDGIADALVRLRDDPDEAARMGERGRGIVDAGLNWEAASARLIRAYEGLRP
ncbi:MAG: glycosyltransferase family 4 protein [Actinomycetota bacterium]|nr:glycosyltransferase family 4 protein [Actinomycetota bacterium]